MGSIGNDQYGKKLKEKIKKDGILDYLYTHNNLQTGVCAVLLTDDNRCLIPNLGAACVYPDSLINAQWSMVERAERYYTTAYFLETSYKAVKRASEYVFSKGRPVYFNLGAKKWITRYSKELVSVLPNFEGIIGNTEEVIELSKIISGEETDIETALRLIMNKQTAKGKRNQFIVATNAHNPTLIAEISNQKLSIKQAPTQKIPKELIKTTNGAGDTLAGGLFGGLIADLDLMASLKLGQRLAFHYVQQTDGSFPSISL
jgi:adenosine kinase